MSWNSELESCMLIKMKKESKWNKDRSENGSANRLHPPKVSKDLAKPHTTFDTN